LVGICFNLVFCVIASSLCPDVANRGGLPVRFRITQTDSKLKREKIRGEEPAIKAHAEVGKEVREAIRRMGNTMPEDLPPELPIKEIEKRLKPKKIAPPEATS